MDTHEQLVHRVTVDEALERLIDHVQGMDCDDLARFLSDRCLDGIVVVADRDSGDESEPFKDGRRMRVEYIPADA